jgi:hypothetical protein
MRACQANYFLQRMECECRPWYQIGSSQITKGKSIGKRKDLLIIWWMNHENEKRLIAWISKLSHPYLHYWPELCSPTLNDKIVKGPGNTELKTSCKDLDNSGSYFICFKNNVLNRKSLPCLRKKMYLCQWYWEPPTSPVDL